MVMDFGSDWANVIDSIPQAVWVADARGDVEFFNRHVQYRDAHAHPVVPEVGQPPSVRRSLSILFVYVCWDW